MCKMRQSTAAVKPKQYGIEWIRDVDTADGERFAWVSIWGDDMGRKDGNGLFVCFRAKYMG